MNKRLNWFRGQKWGIFVHYLYHEQNNPLQAVNMGRGQTDWNECVEEFDTDVFAAQVASTGAGYVFFTVMQGTKFLCAPNAAYDRITGSAAGEACSKRDLIGDLVQSLSKHGVALFLYYTGDGPHKDPVCGPKMGYSDQKTKVNELFVRNWASVAREYSLRYGKNINGWWVDGCYESFGYNDEFLSVYAEAMRAGNPDTLLAFNGGIRRRIFKYSANDDYTCGEMNHLYDLPDSRLIDSCQWHTLAPVGISPNGEEWGAWCKPGCRYSNEFLNWYVGKCNEKGGIVTFDVCLYRDGHIDPMQTEQLKTVGGR